MQIRIDAQSDAIYLDLTQGVIESSKEIADGIILDYDAQGSLVGIEILDAAKKSGSTETLRSLTMEWG
ncbi:MAG: DUF2283 domain-containing protein [Magnetococcus sp. YQC-3]